MCAYGRSEQIIITIITKVLSFCLFVPYEREVKFKGEDQNSQLASDAEKERGERGEERKKKRRRAPLSTSSMFLFFCNSSLFYVFVYIAPML